MDLVQILNIFTSKIGSIFLPSFENCGLKNKTDKHAQFGEKCSNFI